MIAAGSAHCSPGARICATIVRVIPVPEVLGVAIVLGGILPLAGCLTPGQRLFREGEDHLRRKEFVQAESVFTSYLGLEPADASAWYSRGIARAGRGDRIEAMKDLDRAVEIQPRDLDARWMRFTVREMDITAWEADPVVPFFDRPVRHTLVLALLTLQLEELGGILAVDPQDVGARCERGILLRRLGRHAEARADLDAAIDLSPGDVRSRTERGNWFHEAGTYDAALADYAIALRECDTCTWLLYNAALSLRASGRLAEAETTLETLVAADSLDGDAWFMLGETRWALRQEAGACEAWQRSADLGIPEAGDRLASHCRSR